MLKDNELYEVNGGGILSTTGIVLAAISAAISFTAGFLDGLTRPFKCR